MKLKLFNFLIFVFSIVTFGGCNIHKKPTININKYFKLTTRLEHVRPNDTFTLLILQTVKENKWYDSLRKNIVFMGLDVKTEKIIQVNVAQNSDTSIKIGDFVKSYPVRAHFICNFYKRISDNMQLKKMCNTKMKLSPLYRYRSMVYQGGFMKITYTIHTSKF
jgi:hypothetical protein